MKELCKVGDRRQFNKTVTQDETAAFNGVEVHPFYGTFALARDAEWSSRLFVLDMKEEHEEGIGTFVNISHHSPALVGQEVVFTATITKLEGNLVECGIEAKVGDRIIASGSTGQRILTKTQVEQLKEKSGQERGEQ